jgi:hypothetical protein
MITVEFEGDGDTTIRPCAIPPRPAAEPLVKRRTLTVEFEGGEEDLRARPIAPDLLEKIMRFKPHV